MTLTSERVMRCENVIIENGYIVSVKLTDAPEPYIGIVRGIDDTGFVLDMSTTESAHTKRIQFVQVEKIGIVW